MLKFAKTCAYLATAWLILFIYDFSRTQYVAQFAGEEICDRFLHGVDDTFNPDEVHYDGGEIFGPDTKGKRGVENRRVKKIESCRYRFYWNWRRWSEMHFWLVDKSADQPILVKISGYAFRSWFGNQIDIEAPLVYRGKLSEISYNPKDPPKAGTFVVSEGYFERRAD